MNNPQALKFVNEHVRPMAERLRALKAMLDADLQAWQSVVSQFATAAEAVEDGRDTEGVSRMTCGAVTAFIAVLSNLKTRFDAAGVAATIDLPCVRPLQVS